MWGSNPPIHWLTVKSLHHAWISRNKIAGTDLGLLPQCFSISSQYWRSIHCKDKPWCQGCLLLTFRIITPTNSTGWFWRTCQIKSLVFLWIAELILKLAMRGRIELPSLDRQSRIMPLYERTITWSSVEELNFCLSVISRLLYHWANGGKVFLVPRDGIEPPTHRFSVCRSTNWAISA